MRAHAIPRCILKPSLYSIERRQGGHTDLCREDQVAVRWQIRCSRTSAKIDVKGGEMENAFRHWMMWKLGHLVSRVSSPIS